MLILSCDKFSDLWDGHIKLLEQNWPDRDMETYIVTDAPANKSYPKVQIINAGTDAEWSDRLAYALKRVKTGYVFILHWTIISSSKKVEDQSIADLVDMMEKEGTLTMCGYSNGLRRRPERRTRRI